VTSKPGERPGAVAADANVLLSAVLGHAALRVFTHSDVIVFTTGAVLEEVREYLPALAGQYRMAHEALESQLRLLAVRECGPDDYSHKRSAARTAIGERDPDDVELLALALTFGLPIWSNDDDFEDAGVEWFATARLLKRLSL
jgi:predicted nucleic acid-binding protein